VSQINPSHIHPTKSQILVSKYNSTQKNKYSSIIYIEHIIKLYQRMYGKQDLRHTKEEKISEKAIETEQQRITITTAYYKLNMKQFENSIPNECNNIFFHTTKLQNRKSEGEVVPMFN
jgi:hypothetical protein